MVPILPRSPPHRTKPLWGASNVCAASGRLRFGNEACIPACIRCRLCFMPAPWLEANSADWSKACGVGASGKALQRDGPLAWGGRGGRGSMRAKQAKKPTRPSFGRAKCHAVLDGLRRSCAGFWRGCPAEVREADIPRCGNCPTRRKRAEDPKHILAMR